MQEIVDDLKSELAALETFIEDLREADFYAVTPFYEWRVYDEILHLHYVDWLGILSLSDQPAFAKAAAELQSASSEPGYHMAPFTQARFGSPDRPEVMRLWRDGRERLCDLLEQSDPRTRMTWFGPPMGVKSFATARQMETWAHGQDIYDAFGVQRQNGASLRNIANIGVRTYGWSFVVHGEAAPEGPPPFVELIGPGGDVWTWNDPEAPSALRGPAEDFCLVVTQRRHVADTALGWSGRNVEDWMRIAQCFAGGPALGPAPGQRLVSPR
jgi:uncharacterized protein (TIGR03084 family)